MASGSFNTLEPFLPCPGEPPVPYEQWKNRAMAHIRRKGFQLARLPARNNAAPDGAEQGEGADAAQQAQPSAYTDEEKNLDLFLALGSEGQRQFEGTPNAENLARPHKDFIKVLDSLFLKPMNRLIALRTFRHRMQRKDELSSAWCAELRSLARHCNFPDGDVENSEIADTLIVNCYDSDVQQKLFALSMTKDQRLTTDQVLALMHAEEVSKSDVKQLKSGDNLGAGATKITRSNGIRRSRGAHQTSPCGANKQQSSPLQQQFSVKCDGCGKTGHKYMSDSCPARDSKCRFCAKIGHWDQVCRKKAKGVGSLTIHQSSAAVNSSSSDSRIRCDLFLQPTLGPSRKRHKISFLADTGAEASTIRHSVYKSRFCHVPLLATNDKLQGIDSDAGSIAPVGVVCLRATFKNQRSAELPFYIVPDTCLQLLGIHQMSALSMMVDTVSKSVLAVSKTTPALSPDALLDSLELEFPTLFQPGIGKVPNFQHRIQLKPGSVPIRAKMRYPPVAMEDDASKALDELFSEDVIETCEKSEYVHPLHFIRKPDKGIRTKVDFKVGLNKNVVPSAHPLPRPQDIFNKVGDDEEFSKLDVSHAYLTIELSPESRPLTAFITPSHGLCQFKRMPMGLVDSGATFQRCIEQTLCGLDGVHPYCDDIFIHGKTREEHDQRLRAACKRLADNGFRLKRSKLVIAQKEVPLLGHLISATPSGTVIRPDPKNGAAIAKIRIPSNVSEVRSFLGFCNYHSAFIKNYAELSEPLHRLTRKNVRFDWDDSCQRSFDVLKSRIVSPEVLVPFNPNTSTILTTDASDVGLGAMLSQVQNGSERPVAFAARTLSSAERAYSTPERESLGCVWATENFEKFLLGRHFTLRTDQDSLRTLMSRFGDNRTSRRISRWYDRLSHFEYSVEHIKGKDNVAADLLSRLAAALEPSPEPTLPDDDDRVIVAALSSPNIPLQEFTQASSTDSDLALVRDFLSTSWPPRKQIPMNLRGYFTVREELSVHNSLIFRRDNLVVPASLQDRVLKLLHSGHPGIVRMKQKYSQTYFWPGGTKMIEDFVKHCVPCSASGKNARPEPVPVTAIPPPSRPWQKVAIDITGPFWTAPKHQRHVVVITDYFSKFPEILLTDSITSTKIISWLKDIFSRFGNPEELVSDNGPQFTSSEFEDFLSSKNIIHNLSAVYNPSQNGLVEVFNRSIKNHAQIISATGSSFRDGMLEFLASFRSTAPENSLSPSTLLFGWNLRSDADIRNTTVFSNGGAESGGAMTKASVPMEDRQQVVQKKFERRRYGKTKRDPRSPYSEGDRVTVKIPPGEVRKGNITRSPPLTVTKALGRWTYQLDNGQTWNARKLMRYRPMPHDTSDDEYDLQLYSSHENRPRQAYEPVRAAPPSQGPRRTTRATAGVPPRRYSPTPP